MPPKKSAFDSLRDHLSKQVPWANDARRVRPKTFNEFGPWTGLKLYGLHYYIHVYSTIIRDWLHTLGKEEMVYVDILAGSGLNRIRPNDFLPGSTILAARVPAKPFDFILALENDVDRSSALTLRLKRILPQDRFKVIAYDADLSQNVILRELDVRNAHYLAFVDYEGVSGFSWRGMRRLLGTDGDILITLLPGGILRQLGRGWDVDIKNVAAIIGEDLARKVQSEDQLVRGYSKQIRRYRKKVLEVPIRSKTGYHYHLVRSSGDEAEESLVECCRTTPGEPLAAQRHRC